MTQRIAGAGEKKQVDRTSFGIFNGREMGFGEETYLPDSGAYIQPRTKPYPNLKITKPLNLTSAPESEPYNNQNTTETSPDHQ